MAEEEIRNRIHEGGLIPMTFSISPLQKVLEDILDLIGKHEKSINTILETLPSKTDKTDLESLRETVENNKADTDSKIDALEKSFNQKAEELQQLIKDNDDKVQAQFNDTNDKIETHDAQISKLTQDLQNLEEKLNQEIQGINDKVSAHDNTLKDHETRINELEQRKYPENTITSAENASQSNSQDTTNKEINQNNENPVNIESNSNNAGNSNNNANSFNFDPNTLNELKQMIQNNSDKIQNNTDRIRALENAQFQSPSTSGQNTPSNTVQNGENKQNSNNSQNFDSNLSDKIGLLGRRLNTAEESISNIEKALRDLKNNQNQNNNSQSSGHDHRGGASIERNFVAPQVSSGNSDNSSSQINSPQNSVNQQQMSSSNDRTNVNNLGNQNYANNNQNSSNNNNQSQQSSSGPSQSGVSRSNDNQIHSNSGNSDTQKQISNINPETRSSDANSSNNVTKSSSKDQISTKDNTNSSNNKSQSSDHKNSNENKDLPVRPPSSSQKTSPRQSNLQPLPDLPSSDPNEAISQLRQRLAALEQQLSSQNANTNEELKKLARDLNDRPDRSLIERLFEKFKSSLGNVVQMVQAKEGNDGKFATFDDVKRLETLIKHMTQEFDEAAAARRCTKCLSCGMGYRTVSGSIQDPETAAILGAAPVSQVVQAPGKPTFVYGSDNELYYSLNESGKPFVSPRNNPPASK